MSADVTVEASGTLIFYHGETVDRDIPNITGLS